MCQAWLFFLFLLVSSGFSGSSHSLNTCMWGQLETINCLQVWLWAWMVCLSRFWATLGCCDLSRLPSPCESWERPPHNPVSRSSEQEGLGNGWMDLKETWIYELIFYLLAVLTLLWDNSFSVIHKKNVKDKRVIFLTVSLERCSPQQTCLLSSSVTNTHLSPITSGWAELDSWSPWVLRCNWRTIRYSSTLNHPEK